MKAEPSVFVQCPSCEEQIEVPIEVTVANNDYAHLGEARFVCEPDLTEVWAHSFSHDVGVSR